MGCKRSKSIVPEGLAVEGVELDGKRLIICAHSMRAQGFCPGCGRLSRQVHSRYERQLQDLPSHGRIVQLRLRVRRFRCREGTCPRRTFAEQLSDGIAGRWARRTARLQDIVYCLGIALGGRPAVSIAKRLMLPVSKDTLLRAVRRRARPAVDPVHIIGIDDWAWRRHQRYGTIICDLERRRIIDLLPDRETGSVETWLNRHPEINVVARDRSGVYAAAAGAALPGAVQVADRWHLMENASAAFLDAVRRSMQQIWGALDCASPDPALLTAAERLQYERYQQRAADHEAIRVMLRAGTSIKDIVRRSGRSRKLVRSVVRGATGDVFRPRLSTLTPYLTRLGEAWEGGCRNGAELWRRLRADGFRGSLRVVTEWTTRRRRSERAGGEVMRKLPPARTIAQLMLAQGDVLTRDEAVFVAAIEAAVPPLATARDLVDRFQAMIRGRTREALTGWLVDAGHGMLAAFSRGLVADQAAVAAALVCDWSNGQTEGKITKLKMLRRQMYGRGSLGLLRARLLGAEELQPVHGN